MNFKTISLRELEQYIEEGYDGIIIDLRNRSSYEKYHIKGAVNIPYEDIDSGRADLSSDRTMVFYCARGGQSLQVCRYLSARGFPVVNVASGIAYYQGKYLVRE